MARDLSFFQKEFSHASYMLCFHHSWEDFLTIPFHRCLILMKANEYSYAAKAF
jgi:hypothetical protein